jgi:hypothetical protein
MAEERMSGINSVGEPSDKFRTMGGEGGNNERGYLDNVEPTGIVARGNECSAKDGYDRGVRKQMSTMRNESKARGMSDRK